MALTVRDYGTSTSNSATYSGNSVTLTANVPCIAVWVVRGTVTIDTLTCAGHATTWTNKGEDQDAVAGITIAVFEGVAPASPSADTLDLTLGTGTAAHAMWFLLENPDWDAAGIIEQVKFAEATAATSVSATLDTTPDASAHSLLVAANRLYAAMTPSTDFVGGDEVTNSPLNVESTGTMVCFDAADNNQGGATWTGSQDAICVVAEINTGGVSITDLAVTTANMVDGEVPLTFTAPGEAALMHREETTGFTPSAGSEIGSIGSTDTDFLDDGVDSSEAPDPDTIYYYVITDAANVALSNYVGQQMPPPRPSSLVVGTVTDTSIEVTAVGGATSTTRDRNDWWYRTPATTGVLKHLMTTGSGAAYTTQVYDNLTTGTTYRLMVRAGSSTTGLWSGFTTVDQATAVGEEAVTDGVSLGDSATVIAQIEVSAEDVVDVGDSARSPSTLNLSVTDGIKVGDYFYESTNYLTDSVGLGDYAVVSITYPDVEEPPEDTSGWTEKSGLAYPPNVVPELEPWMERVRVTLENVIEEVQGGAQVLSLNMYVKESGAVYANVRANEDTVAVKYLFSDSTYPTAAQVDNSGGSHVITSIADGFEIGPFGPFLTDGQTGYLGVVGYSTKTETDVPSGRFSRATYGAVTYEMGQGTGTEEDLAPTLYWRTEESATVGTIYLTASDPQGDDLSVSFWTKVGGGTVWTGPTVRSPVTSGSTEVFTVGLTSGHNSYIRFEVTNTAGYTNGGTTTFDPDTIPQVLAMNLEIDGSGNVVANWQGDTDTAKVKIAAAVGGGYPNETTVRAATFRNGQYGTTPTLGTLAVGETLYVSGFGYSSTDEESPELSKVSLKRAPATAAEIGAQPSIHSGISAPSSPAVDDLWVDTSVTPTYLKRWTGAAWVEIGILDQGLVATLDTITDAHMTVGSLSAIAADVGLLKAGIVRNPTGGTYDVALVLSGSTAGYDKFIDLDSTGTDYFIYAGTEFWVKADGTANFGGTITSAATVEAEEFTAAAAYFDQIVINGTGLVDTSLSNTTINGPIIQLYSWVATSSWSLRIVGGPTCTLQQYYGSLGGAKISLTGTSVLLQPDGSTNALQVDSNGNIFAGTGDTTVSRSDNFLFVPQSAGAPTGSPSTSNRSPIVIDTSNLRVYFRIGATWRYASLT